MLLKWRTGFLHEACAVAHALRGTTPYGQFQHHSSAPNYIISMPCAPRRIAFCIARFIARLNIIRFSNCCAIESAINCASISGFLISSILTCTGHSHLPLEAQPSDKAQYLLPSCQLQCQAAHCRP